MAYEDDLLKGKSHVHFIGIGGSGMFPLAQILHSEGYYITGSDNNPSDTLELVKSLGIPVTMGQRRENIEGADLIVHTAAIMADNEELIAAKESGVTVIERSVLLGLITKRYSNAICVSGTHGKTTTSAMIAHILLDAEVDPTVVIGGKLKKIGGNGRAGKSEVMVCEACEFVDTFLKLSPNTSIILNIDRDHMDYFHTMDKLISSFHKFCELTTGTIIANGENMYVRQAILNIPNKIIRVGFADTNDYYPANINVHSGEINTTFTIMHKGEAVTDIDLYVPGKHNVYNATVAAVAALEQGVTPQKIKESLQTFMGAGRRFELIGMARGVTIVDDYAHHPAEIEATLQAAKGMGFERVIAVHQPFTYSRTKLHLNEFGRVLSMADHTVLSEIMGSREKNTFNIYAADLAKKVYSAVWFETFPEIVDYLMDYTRKGDLVITLGCGDIYKVAKEFYKRLSHI